MTTEAKLTREQWQIALAAVEGFHAQLLALVGPFADVTSPRAMSAVRVLGQLRWIEAEFKRALLEE